MIRLDEGRIPLLCFIATVPASDEIYTSGEETRLERSEQYTAYGERYPTLDETLPYHDSAPRHSDKGQPVGTPNFSKDDVRRKFEQEVRRKEEDQDDGISITDLEVKICPHSSNTRIGNLSILFSAKFP